jgi:hypothetical protein
MCPAPLFFPVKKPFRTSCPEGFGIPLYVPAAYPECPGYLTWPAQACNYKFCGNITIAVQVILFMTMDRGPIVKIID